MSGKIRDKIYKLPYEGEYELLPPGASADGILTVADISGKKFYYTNVHNIPTQFTVKREKLSDEFVSLFQLFDSFCEFPENKQEFEIDTDTNLFVDKERYFNETLWLCNKCKAGNLLEHRYCVKCGEYRGW